uniref:Uncharacterized protein n=1 Tax=Arundo donax TaxID=35708 RepID=A0A0A9EFU0_ARUDO
MGSVGISSSDSRKIALNIATSNLAMHSSITNLANIGRHPHSCPAALTGQSLSDASLKAFLHMSIDMVACCWLPTTVILP